MISYHFNKEMQILEVNYIGNVTFEDLMEYGEMMRNNKSFPRELKIITDASSASYQLEPEDIAKLLKALREQVKPFNTVKNAVLHQKPKETAMSFLVENDGPIPNYKHNVFSTREAALAWLFN